jgi:non-specific serine/threonine protein kinase
MTRFFGREEELQWLIAQFQEPHTRLITLTGPGGIGKTRLAIEAAEHLRTVVAGRAWFVALAEVQDRERVLTAIASALALTRTPETDPLPQIVRALSIAPALLVLDNLEQVVEASADVVATLLTQVPGLSILASSRQTLGVAGEREMAVSVLTAPLPDEGLSGLLAIPAVQLFLDRAQACGYDRSSRHSPGRSAARH